MKLSSLRDCKLIESECKSLGYCQGHSSKATPTNTSLREEIHLKMLAKSESAKDLGELTVVPLGFAVSVAESLLTAKTTEAEEAYYFKGYKDGRTSVEAEQLQQLDKGEA